MTVTAFPKGPFIVVNGVICYPDTHQPVRGGDLVVGEEYEVLYGRTAPLQNALAKDDEPDAGAAG